MRLKDKVCVVTGSSSGIGFSVANAFVKEGAKVVIMGMDKQSSEEALLKIKTKYPNADLLAQEINVSDTISVERAFKNIYNHFGKIDVLVNNAGITLTKTVEELTDEDYAKIMNVNIGGVFKCTREVLKYMENGSIVNTASMNGIYGAPKQSIYSASKAAIIGFTKSCAKELGKKNIRVNAIAPGMIDTNMVKKFVTDEVRANLIRMTPLNRIGLPEDLDGIYVFLASDESSFITGTVISVDGGLIM